MRGVIRNRAKANQVNDFSGLRFGNITPTDLDGIIDFRDRAWVIIEMKTGSAPMPYGQRLALARLTDSLYKTKPSICIVASHHTMGDIPVASCQVTELRWKGEWKYPSNSYTVREFVDIFLNSQDIVI